MNEELFIITASRLSLSESDISLLTLLSTKISDWGFFLQTAVKHGVASIIYHTLKRYSLTDLIPLDVRDQLKKFFYGVASHNLNLLQMVEKAAGLTDEKIVLLKGIDLVESLYPNIGIRAMQDIDILVRPESVNIIMDELSAECCKATEKKPLWKSAVHEKLSLQHIKHIPPLFFKHGLVEIHWNLFHGNEHSEITKKIWESVVPYKKYVHVYRLSNEYMLLHLCVNFYGDLYGGVVLRMLCDIHELISKYSETLNWDTIRILCKNPELRDQINIALTYTSIYYNTPVPQDFIRGDIARNTRRSLEALLSGINSFQRSSLKDFFSNLDKLDRPADKITFLYRTFFPEKAWLLENFRASNSGNVILAYFRYWNHHFF